MGSEYNCYPVTVMLSMDGPGGNGLPSTMMSFSSPAPIGSMILRLMRSFFPRLRLEVLALLLVLCEGFTVALVNVVMAPGVAE